MSINLFAPRCCSSKSNAPIDTPNSKAVDTTATKKKKSFNDIILRGVDRAAYYMNQAKNVINFDAEVDKKEELIGEAVVFDSVNEAIGFEFIQSDVTILNSCQSVFIKRLKTECLIVVGCEQVTIGMLQAKHLIVLGTNHFVTDYLKLSGHSAIHALMDVRIDHILAIETLMIASAEVFLHPGNQDPTGQLFIFSKTPVSLLGNGTPTWKNSFTDSNAEWVKERGAINCDAIKKAMTTIIDLADEPDAGDDLNMYLPNVPVSSPLATAMAVLSDVASDVENYRTPTTHNYDDLQRRRSIIEMENALDAYGTKTDGNILDMICEFQWADEVKMDTSATQDSSSVSSIPVTPAPVQVNASTPLATNLVNGTQVDKLPPVTDIVIENSVLGDVSEAPAAVAAPAPAAKKK